MRAAILMDKSCQYSLLSLFGVMALFATGLAILCWDVDQQRIRSIEEWNRVVEQWNHAVDHFEKFQTWFHQPSNEVDILVRLMRQNPQHSLWKEFEYAPIFNGKRESALGGFHLSWPQNTIHIGEESVHVLTSQHPCNSRKLVVHTDNANRILDYKVAAGINMYEQLELTVTSLQPQPVVRVACWKRDNSNDPPIVTDLTLTKSSARGIDPQSITIIDRQKR